MKDIGKKSLKRLGFKLLPQKISLSLMFIIIVLILALDFGSRVVKASGCLHGSGRKVFNFWVVLILNRASKEYAIEALLNEMMK